MLATALFVCSLLTISCSQDDTEPSAGITNLPVSIFAEDGGVTGQAQGTRAVTDAKYHTTFVSGDRMGVYAVKNGAVCAGIDNTPVTYNADRKTWTVADADKSKFENTAELEGADFYAYYPYKPEVSGFDATAADPVAGIAAAWTIADDLSDDNYTSSDLMTAKAAAVKSGNDYRITFSMQHKMGLVVIKLPTITYKFQNSPAIADYSVPASNPVFMLTQGAAQGVAKTAYYDAESQTYRLLVRPDEAFTINGSYNNEAAKYTIDSRTVAASKYVRYNIGGGDATEKTYTLSVGDYYCADGSIAPGSETAPSNAIGVVYYVGNPQPSAIYPDKVAAEKDALLRDRPACVHGLVIALNNAVADDVETSRIGFGKYEFTSWLTANSLTSSYLAFSETSMEASLIQGYNNSKVIELTSKDTSPIPGDTKGNTIDMASNGFSPMLAAYRAAVAVPAEATDWFLPSWKELDLIRENYDAIAASVQKAGGSLPGFTDFDSSKGSETLDGHFYWSSTERGSSNMWVSPLAALKSADMPLYINRTSNGTRGYFRFAIAF